MHVLVLSEALERTATKIPFMYSFSGNICFEFSVLVRCSASQAEDKTAMNAVYTAVVEEQIAICILHESRSCPTVLV